VGRLAEARVKEGFRAANQAVTAVWKEVEVEKIVEAAVIIKIWILKRMMVVKAVWNFGVEMMELLVSDRHCRSHNIAAECCVGSESAFIISVPGVDGAVSMGESRLDKRESGLSNEAWLGAMVLDDVSFL